jgi:hypothetical protein
VDRDNPTRKTTSSPGCRPLLLLAGSHLIPRGLSDMRLPCPCRRRVSSVQQAEDMTLLVCIKPKVWNLLPMTPIEALRYGSSPTGRFFWLPVLSECCHNFECLQTGRSKRNPTCLASSAQ